MSTAKTSERRRRPYLAGEFVFAKLKGYPWWPAKIEDESNVPKAVLEAKRKKKTAINAYIVFFFGSLDYAFFSEKMLRPFNHEIVQQEMKTAKFKNKELVEALFQALESTSLNSLQKPIHQQDHGHGSSIETDQPWGRRKNTATATKCVSKAIKKRSLESKSRSSGDPPISPRSSKKRQKLSPIDIPISSRKEDPKPRPSPRKSKYTKAAATKSTQHEHIYGYRCSLQKLIYDKKPGEIPAGDYSKISDILQEVERCDMTKELLKDTKIGKVVQSGSRYVFGNDCHYRLQERCVEIMENWKTSLLDQPNLPTAHNTVTTVLTARTKCAITNDNSEREAKDKHRLKATPTPPRVDKNIPFATESYNKSNNCTSANILTFENNKNRASKRKRHDNGSKGCGTTAEWPLLTDPLGRTLGHLVSSSKAPTTTAVAQNLILLRHNRNEKRSSPPPNLLPSN